MNNEQEAQQPAKGEAIEAWQAWEEYSKGLEVPPNAHAFAAGYKMAKDKYESAAGSQVSAD